MIGQSKNTDILALAPDALVFINGSDSINICPLCGCGVKIADVLTSISIDASVDSAPGSASLSIANPQHLDSPLYDEIKSAFTPMQEVEIFMKSRFTKDGQFRYYPVFWGFISAVSDNYSDGNYNLSINCKDILRWWEITRINIKPGSLDTSINSSVQPVIFSSSYANVSIPQIIKDLAKLTVSELLPVQNINEFSDTNKIKTFSKSNLEMLDYWKTRFDQVGRAIRIFGYNNREWNNENIAELNRLNVISSAEAKDSTKASTDLTESRQGSTGVQSGDLLVRDLIGFNIPEIDKVFPSVLSVEAVGLFSAEPMSKLDIANEVKEIIKYEFFMDTNGEVIFKPPFYNMDVSDNPIHVIEDIDVIDWGFTEDESGIVTRVDVTGAWTNIGSGNVDNPQTTVWGMYQDYFRAKQFGLRHRKFSSPFLRTKEQCEIYAHSELNRLNALLKTGSMTIAGRPELRLGYPVYVKGKDAFYYVTGVNHTFSFGSSFTTSLTLTAERKRLYKDDGITPRKNLAIILENLEETSEKQALEYAIKLRNSSPSIKDGELKTQIIKKYNLRDVLLQRVVNYSRQAVTANTSSYSKNPLARVYDPCVSSPIEKSKLFTIDEYPISGNQGKTAKFVERKISIDKFEDLRDNMQITDENGYVLIGTFPYGRYSKIRQSKIASRTLNELSSVEENPFREAAFMLPDSEQKNKTIDKDDVRPNFNDKNQMMVTIADDESISQYIKDMAVSTEEYECSCSCHTRRR